MDKKKQVLGRGLGALIPAARGGNGQAASVPNIQAQSQTGESVREVPVSEIEANPYQTRVNVDPKGIEELAESIKVQGVMQPVILRQLPGGKLQLVAGQRRLLASERAGKATIPAIVRQLSDEQAIELTIIENLQREDLNPLDQAAAFEKLSSKCGLTQEQIAARTGKERATVANYMRLLKLPAEVQTDIRSGALSMGHARALMALNHPADQVLVAQKIEERGLSVRQTEQLVAEWGRPKTRKVKEAPRKDPNVVEVERSITVITGCRVHIDDNGGKGKITLEYRNLEEFETIAGFFDMKFRMDRTEAEYLAKRREELSE
ncbi:MAG TPA: ParB/RepB/Spo0J family partition protein [Terriglobales bacterium]|nr:ParB/RepB/Spo0J family partition protein [Terriglobales bacterium]